MKKKIVLILLSSLLVVSTIVGCGKTSGDLTVSDVPETEISIDGKNSDDITGFTYLYDYGNGFRLYADNYTKIIYVMYYGSSGSGAKNRTETGLSPWISPNGTYCYIDTENRIIKELNTDNVISSIDENTDSTDDLDNENNQQSSASSENGDSSNIDQSVTDKINQNSN